MLLTKYDIRGLLNKDIYPELLDCLLKKFLEKTKSKKLLLGSDFNEKNLIIRSYLLQRYPFIFEDLGSLPSPIFYYYVIKRKTPGIMLTASHLPFNYVGLKFVLTEGTNWKPVKLPKLFKKSKFSQKAKKIFNFNQLLIKNYFLELKKHLKIKQKNFVRFNLKNYFLKKCQPYFQLLKIFYRKNSDFSVDSDGDNDRIIIFYRNKEVLPDFIFFSLARDKNYQRLGVPIYFSKFLEKKLLAQGKKIFYIKTGHIYFKKAYRRLKLDLAFEPSGHFYFFKDLKTEAPYLALAKFLNLRNKDVEKFFPAMEIKRFSLKLNKSLNLEKLVFSLQKKFSLKLKKFDGFFLFDQKKNIFLHLRKSATENLLRVSLEAKEAKILEKEIKNATTRNS